MEYSILDEFCCASVFRVWVSIEYTVSHCSLEKIPSGKVATEQCFLPPASPVDINVLALYPSILDIHHGMP